MDVNAYLDRIGAPRTGSADLARLRALHHAHLTTVPFENLDIHRGVRLSLAPEDLFDKVVRRGRGGFCFELNGLFALLLERSGYRVDRVAARVPDGARLGPPSHLALVVSAPAESGSRWLADVGFGDHSVYPLDLTSRADQDDPAGRFVLADTPDGDVDVLRDGRLQYRLETRARGLAFFETMCWYHQTSPDSHFTRKTVCTRLTAHGRVTISDRTLIVTTGDGRSETPLESGAPLLTAYRDHFGIDLPAGAGFRPPHHS
ncbi:arylamine N-acetyltransferase family protein [Actinoplanes utahensis]|uniref:arylamine N-acetyltransferase family protein n=1 Tax=Actinoplanes utahensis TaxID=1869 RepID=UPI00068B0881|nr:arylamine N-acetyltransferase [Actinoplanes utahensis]GIF27596.1 N-hydroxyarylamine O-acetyltransferase [Actinoplanes utahensis]